MATGPTGRRSNRPTGPAVTDGLRVGLASCAAIACLIGSIAASLPAAGQIADECSQQPSPGTAPSLPGDVCSSGGEALPKDFSALSWQIFKFLIWPAASGERGKPDATRKITNMRGPRTFETLKADWEIFQPDGREPLPWSAYPGVAGPCSNHPKLEPGELVLASFSKFGNLKVFSKSVTNVLVAQNLTYVRYQAAYDSNIFETIVKGRLYSGEIVDALPAPGPDDFVPDAAKEPDGALTVKSAWIELPKGRRKLSKRIDRSRFYVHHRAWLQNPKTLTCRRADVGLVGLHLVYKTHSRPQWIWATFEHVDNVPEPDEPPRKSYTFHNGDLNVHMSDAAEPEFQLPRPANSPLPEVPLRAYQVERKQKIHQAVLDANDAWRKQLVSLGSIWQHYKLVMAQWPGFPNAPRHDAASVLPVPVCSPTSTATANTTMETFLQGPNCDQLKATCMGCHDIARKTDFVWSIQLNAHRPSSAPGPAPEPSVPAVNTLQEFLQKPQSKF
jgi:hypothetical protein